MQSKAKTVAEYLSSLPADRRKALSAVRRVIRKNLGKGYQEGMLYGAIAYYVPHSVFPAGYHCDPSIPLPFAGLASQKNYMTLSLMCVYESEEYERWFREEWVKTGKKLDMGKSCVRFRKIEDVALEVVGQAIKRVPARTFIENYKKVLASRAQGSGAGRKKANKKRASNRRAGKKKSTRSSPPATP